jgi:hypothetical protein
MELYLHSFIRFHCVVPNEAQLQLFLLLNGACNSDFLRIYGLDVRDSIPGGGNEKDFSPRHRGQTGFGIHPASYPMGTGDLSAEDKGAGA